jgi:PAS domain S-box-containing protein
VASCRRWMLTQVGLQEEGAAPDRWTLPAPEAPVLVPAALSPGLRAELDSIAVAAVAADDGNRIVHVNAAAAALLGWDAEELVGRRLVTIVPHHYREAHLAGFTHHLLTGEKRLLDRDIRVPMLRRDGSHVDVWLRIGARSADDGRPVFVAHARPGRG